MDRFLRTVEKFDTQSIVRFTADYPMIDPKVIDEIVLTFNSGDRDYVSNCGKRTYPDGLNTEIFLIQRLKIGMRKRPNLFFERITHLSGVVTRNI